MKNFSIILLVATLIISCGVYRHPCGNEYETISAHVVDINTSLKWRDNYVVISSGDTLTAITLLDNIKVGQSYDFTFRQVMNRKSCKVTGKYLLQIVPAKEFVE